MRAVTYVGPGELRIEDLPDKQLGRGEVRLTVEACGICGTDVRIFKGEHAAYEHGHGRVPGHEIVGKISEIADGAELSDLSIGDRVFVAPNIGCGACAQCAGGNENLCPHTQALGITLDGAFADQVIVPAAAVARGNLIPLSASVDPHAATLIEPLACVLRGQQKATLGLGDTVLVSGGGPVGLLHVALAKASGAAQIICAEPSPIRRNAAVRAGATETIDPITDDLVSLVFDTTDGLGMDVVITAAPIHALQTQALELAAANGRVLYFGGLPKSKPDIEINSNTIHYRELSVVGTTASTIQNCRDAAQLINSAVLKLDWMVSDVVSLDGFDSAIAKVQDATALKVVLDPQLKTDNPK